MGIKKFLLSKAFIGSAIGVVAAAAATAVVLLNQTPGYRIIKVFDFLGTATVTRTETKEITPFKGMNLESGDSISVLEESSMQLTLDDDKYVTLDENTTIDLIATGSPDDSKTDILLTQGSIYNEITKPLSNNSTYEVNTPKATMAVRGTKFRVTVKQLEDGSYITTVNVDEGRVEVRLLDEEGKPKDESIFLEAGDSISIKTEPTTNNDATIDGNSFFVKLDPVTGLYVPLFETDDSDENKPETTTAVSESTPATTTAASTTAVSTTTAAPVTTSSAVPAITANDVDIAVVTSEAPVTTKVTSKTPKTTAKTTTQKPNVTTAKTTKAKPVTTTKPVAPTTSKSSVTFITNTPIFTFPVTSAFPPNVNITTTTATPVTQAPVIITTTVPVTEVTTVTSASTTVPVTENTTTSATTTSASETTTTTTEPVVTYVVEFLNADGTVYKSEEVEENETVSSVPEVPAHPDYEENSYTAEWATGENTFDPTAPITANVTVTPKYTLNTYTVTWTNKVSNTNGTLTFEHGEKLVPPAITATTGYTGSWKYENGTEFNAADVVTEDVTIIYTETINTYTVTFMNGDTDTKIGTDTVNYGDTVTLPTVTATTGYTGSWKYENGTEFNEADVITEDVTIVYTETINTYTVTWTNEVSNTNGTLTFEYGEKLVPPTVTATTGYTGVWKYDNDEICGEDDIVTESINITYTETIGTYTVTFKNIATGDTIAEHEDVEYGTLISTLVPTDDLGNGVWKYEDGQALTNVDIVEGDTIINFVPTYTADFYNYATGPIEEDVVIEHGATIESILPTVEGNGEWKWFDYDSFIIGETCNLTDTVTGETVLLFVPAYTITLSYPDTSGNTVTKSIENIEYGTLYGDIYIETPDDILLTDNSDAENPKYFNGWINSADGNEIADNTPITSNLTLNASYTTYGAELILLNYNDDGSYTVISDDVYGSNSYVALPDIAVNKNWVGVFSGTNTQHILDNGTALTAGEMLTSDKIEVGDTSFSPIPSSSFDINGKYNLLSSTYLVAVNHYTATFTIDVNSSTFTRLDNSTLDESYYKDFEYIVPVSFSETLKNGVSTSGGSFNDKLSEVLWEIDLYIYERLGNEDTYFVQNGVTYKFYDSSGNELTEDSVLNDDNTIKQDVTVKLSCNFKEQE